MMEVLPPLQIDFSLILYCEHLDFTMLAIVTLTIGYLQEIICFSYWSSSS